MSKTSIPPLPTSRSMASISDVTNSSTKTISGTSSLSLSNSSQEEKEGEPLVVKRDNKVIVGIVTCWDYRDAWAPFNELFDRFWPECPYLTTLITDRYYENWGNRLWKKLFWSYDSPSWTSILSTFLYTMKEDQYLLMYLEDFLPSSPVDGVFIKKATRIMDDYPEVGCFRVHPCPGSDESWMDHPDIGRVSRKAPYRISTQVSLWRPSFMRKILQRTKTPHEFELLGTEISRSLEEEILSVKREMNPWPIDYINTAITRGKWQRSALNFCERNGIKVDPLHPIEEDLK